MAILAFKYFKANYVNLNESRPVLRLVCCNIMLMWMNCRRLCLPSRLSSLHKAAMTNSSDADAVHECSECRHDLRGHL